MKEWILENFLGLTEYSTSRQRKKEEKKNHTVSPGKSYWERDRSERLVKTEGLG